MLMPTCKSKRTFLINQRGMTMFMTDDEINDYYDSHPNLTLAQLSRITGKTVEQLKKILMGE
jgi:hypothetical protein